jgi:hypothetical protein
MKMLPASITVLCLCMFTQGTKADWMYDFASPPPGSFITTVIGPPSPTFSSSIAGGVLRLADTRTPAEGGAGSGAGVETSQAFSDVRIETLVNPTGTSDDLLNVFVRFDFALNHTYAAGIDFSTGVLDVVKLAGAPVLLVLSTDASQGSQPPLTDLSRGYYLRLDAVGNQLSASVFDAPGGTELLHASFIDTGAVGGPAYDQGLAGVSAVARGLQLDATFDNLSAGTVPEPSTAALGIVTVLGLLRRLRRDRKSGHCRYVENLQ